MIRRDRQPVTTIGRDAKAAPAAGEQPGGSHQSGDAFATHQHTALAQRAHQAWPSIRLPAVGMRQPQLRRHACIVADAR